jgi:hypothetical protein
MQEIDNNSKGNKILKTLITILIILIIGVLSISFIFTQKQTAPSVFGYNIFVMNGKGMEPAVKDKSAIITKVGVAPEKGEVALCRLKITEDKNIVTVLRVVEIDTKDGNKQYYLKSDNSSNSEVIIAGSDEIIGKADLEVHWLGVVISFATSRAGILIFIIAPAALILISLLISILRHTDEDDEEITDYIPSLTDTNDNEEAPEKILSNNKIDIVQETKPEEIVEVKKDKHKDKKPDIDDIIIPKRPEFIKEIESPVVEEKSANDKPIISSAEEEKQTPTLSESISQEKDVENIPNATHQEKEVVTISEPAPQEIDKDIISKTVATSAHVTLDKDGKAEYNKVKPTASVSELEKVLPNTPVKHSDRATKSIDNLLKSIESSKLNTAKKENTNTNSESINIAPEPKKSSTNKTLEEMMKLLDQQRKNLN